MEFCAALNGANLDTLDLNYRRRMGPKRTRAQQFHAVDEERAAAVSGDPARIRRALRRRLGIFEKRNNNNNRSDG